MPGIMGSLARIRNRVTLSQSSYQKGKKKKLKNKKKKKKRHYEKSNIAICQKVNTPKGLDTT